MLEPNYPYYLRIMDNLIIYSICVGWFPELELLEFLFSATVGEQEEISSFTVTKGTDLFTCQH